MKPAPRPCQSLGRRPRPTNRLRPPAPCAARNPGSPAPRRRAHPCAARTRPGSQTPRAGSSAARSRWRGSRDCRARGRRAAPRPVGPHGDAAIGQPGLEQRDGPVVEAGGGEEGRFLRRRMLFGMELRGAGTHGRWSGTKGGGARGGRLPKTLATPAKRARGVTSAGTGFRSPAINVARGAGGGCKRLSMPRPGGGNENGVRGTPLRRARLPCYPTSMSSDDRITVRQWDSAPPSRSSCARNSQRVGTPSSRAGESHR